MPLSLTAWYERGLQRRGYSCITGVDEVGRGSWAGPVVAGAVILHFDVTLSGVHDSKKLSSAVREEAFARITRAARAWSVGVVAPEVIDRVGIDEAQRRAMRQALAQLRCIPDIVLVDGRVLPAPGCVAIPHGDARVRSIAAASIIAKVWRDHLMRAVHARFPLYAFDAHKGYGTRAHERAISAHGMSRVHRRSFVPSRCRP